MNELVLHNIMQQPVEEQTKCMNQVLVGMVAWFIT